MDNAIHTRSSAQQPKFLDQLGAVIPTKHYSIRTEETYLNWIKSYILFHNKHHPSELGEKEINQFLSHLEVKGREAATTQNQALCAIVFLYMHVLILGNTFFIESSTSYRQEYIDEKLSTIKTVLCNLGNF